MYGLFVECTYAIWGTSAFENNLWSDLRNLFGCPNERTSLVVPTVLPCAAFILPPSNADSRSIRGMGAKKQRRVSPKRKQVLTPSPPSSPPHSPSPPPRRRRGRYTSPSFSSSSLPHPLFLLLIRLIILTIWDEVPEFLFLLGAFCAGAKTTS